MDLIARIFAYWKRKGLKQTIRQMILEILRIVGLYVPEQPSIDLPDGERIILSSWIATDRLTNLETETQLAVQAHIFYLDTLDSIIDSLKKVPYPFDCYVSTDTDEKKEQIEECFLKAGLEKPQVELYPNRGRDVAPFLLQMKSHYKDYKYICHIHSKKTSASGYGNHWREYLYRHLFGNKEHINTILNLFEKDEKIALIYPDTYPILKLQEEWSGNRPSVIALLERLGIEAQLSDIIEFPVGNMFWMRSQAVEKILGYDWKMDDFPEEAGQLDLTIGHQIERSWKMAVEAEGYRIQLIYNDRKTPELEPVNRLFLFAHYNADKRIDESDVAYVTELGKSGKVVFVTNSGTLEIEEKDKIKDFTIEILERENHGYDFGAWKAAMQTLGFETLREYEEVVLVNNSCYAPIFPLTGIFEEMKERTCDFWSITEFPYISNGKFIGKKCIKRHLQSYFMVFRKPMLTSDAFKEYWNSVKEYNVMEEVVAHCESEMTDYFEKHGFTSAAYIDESGMACEYMCCHAIPFELPYQMFLLGNPLVKKKAESTIKENEMKLVNGLRNR